MPISALPVRMCMSFLDKLRAHQKVRKLLVRRRRVVAGASRDPDKLSSCSFIDQGWPSW